MFHLDLQLDLLANMVAVGLVDSSPTEVTQSASLQVKLCSQVSADGLPWSFTIGLGVTCVGCLCQKT